ncbi:MAG: hypothetical protein KTR20_10940 [Cellvibrionaceae bacterium]|nr:hypothetical protein [Cellvibrionaceae bacterium]
MILRTVLYTALAIGVFACSTAPTHPESRNNTVDTQTPANYSDYKIWRNRHDPQGKAYAEFKAWEAEYRRWQQVKPQNSP